MTVVDEIPAGTLEYLDPQVLLRHPANIRRSTGDLTGLRASIRKLGVRVPLLVKIDADQNHVVVDGHRRLEAAVSEHLPLVPVFVAAGDGSDLEDMAATQLQRLDLTAAEEAAAYVQLQAEGLDVAAIAETTGMDPARVQRGLDVGGSKAAAKAAAKLKELTLDQAAVLVEFEADDQAVADLTHTVTSDPAQFDHVAEKLRQVRKAEELYQAAVARAKADGLTVIEKQAGYSVSGKNCPIMYLAGSATGGQTEAKHRKGCEGHAVCITRGHLAAHVVSVCTAPSKFHPILGKEPAKVKPNAEEQAAALAEKEELEQRAADWDAATAVRRAHAKKVLERKTPPKGALRFAIERIALNPYIPGEGDDDSVYNDLVGTEGAGDRLKRAVKVPDQQLPMILLGLVIAGVEKDMESVLQPWAGPRQTWQEDLRPTMAAYLAWLATTGYTLAPVEEFILPKPVKKPTAKKAPAKAPAKKVAARG